MNKNFLPEYDIRMGRSYCDYGCKEDRDYYARQTWAYEPVVKYIDRLVEWVVVYVERPNYLYTDQWRARNKLYAAERLEGIGYEFRKTPIPYTRKGKNQGSAPGLIGARTEHYHNLECDREYGEYNLVRAKRSSKVKSHITRDYDIRDVNWKSPRSWKANKKRKQYQ